MPDVIDRFRHWMIRKLSCGDMVILNASIRSDGSFTPRNLGPVTVANVEVHVINDDFAVILGGDYSGFGKLKITGAAGVTFRNVCTFRTSFN